VRHGDGRRRRRRRREEEEDRNLFGYGVRKGKKKPFNISFHNVTY